MKVRMLESDFWEVDTDHNWYTVKLVTAHPHTWYITNAKGTQVSPRGALGRKLIKLIEAVEEI